MSKGVELVTKQETIVLPKTKQTIAQGAPMVIKVRYNEPKLNQHNGKIVRGVSNN
jgi:hypothetical protein